MSAQLLPSFRRQQLVLDFSFLKDRCSDGLYLSLTPGDASLWIAVLFVRKGPYEGAILRFQVSFPDTYPEAPPLVTFSSDVFHPLVVPLTTYTFNASVFDASTSVSASDEGRLPPGAFSLRHGFPWWFDSTLTSPVRHGRAKFLTSVDPESPISQLESPQPCDRINEDGLDLKRDRNKLILMVVQHIQDAFEREDCLDAIPLDSVGDPSAWHAWRAFRGLAQKATGADMPLGANDDTFSNSPRDPGHWKWDGVWESRTANAIEASTSEAGLFGSTATMQGGPAIPAATNATHRFQRPSATADRQIRFTKLGEERFDELRYQIMQSGTPAAAS